jgi:uncharacterized protein YndB with AHSA1/START domain
MGALTSSEQLSEGAPGQGARFHDVLEDHGQRFEVESEVVRYEPPTRLELVFRAKAFQATSAQELVEEQGRTRLTIVIELEFKGAARLFASMVTGSAQRQLEEDLQTLRELVERG